MTVEKPVTKLKFENCFCNQMMTVFAKKRESVDRDVCKRKRKLESKCRVRQSIHFVKFKANITHEREPFSARRLQMKLN